MLIAKRLRCFFALFLKDQARPRARPWPAFVNGHGVFAAVGIVLVRAFVPETKGRSLEEIEAYWTEGRAWPASRRAAQRQTSAPGGAHA